MVIVPLPRDGKFQIPQTEMSATPERILKRKSQAETGVRVHILERHSTLRTTHEGKTIPDIRRIKVESAHGRIDGLIDYT